MPSLHERVNYQPIKLISKASMLPRVQVGLLEHARVGLLQRRISTEAILRFLVGLLTSFACSFREFASVLAGEGGAVSEEGREGGEEGDESFRVGVDEYLRVW